MFERYTEAARRAVFFARYEVSQLGDSAIETEHLLLGLIGEHHGVVARILDLSRVSAEQLRSEISNRAAARSRLPTSVEVPFSPVTQRALQSAVEEADRFTHSYVGTEHLLLGLLREESSVAGTILARHGLRLEDVRGTIVKILAEPPAPLDSTPSRGGLCTHVDHVIRSVERLAGMLPDGTEEHQLAGSIRESLEKLKRRIAG